MFLDMIHSIKYWLSVHNNHKLHRATREELNGIKILLICEKCNNCIIVDELHLVESEFRGDFYAC